MTTELKREAKTCKDLSYALNIMGFDYKTFFEQFDQEHRTLQSEMFDLALRIVAHCANKDYRTDGRNEWCQRVAQQIVDNNPDQLYY